MTARAPAPSDKFARYRERKRAQGLREIRLWVPDPDAPGMRQELERQAATLRGAPEESDAVAFLEGVEREDGWPE